MKIPQQWQRDILFYSFRYTLGRSTYAPHTVIKALKKVWLDLPASDRALYQREIREAIENGRAGMDVDVRAWKTVLELEVDE